MFLLISVSSLPLSDTNIISLNCRGNKRKLVSDFLQYSIRSNRVCMVLLQETHSDETVIRRVARRLGRSWCFTLFPTAGASGGIALQWNASFVKTQVLSIHSHYLNAVVRFMNSDPWILTGVYARVSITNRNLLWNSLGAIGLNDFPWIICGDYNCISCAQDILGGTPFTFSASVRQFNQFLLYAALCDLGFIGPKFTQCNDRKGSAVF